MNINITKILKAKKGEVLFNPSIVHWKKNLYLISYRTYIRYVNLNTKDYTDNPFFNPNHPWLGGSSSMTWWNSGYGYDKTRLALIKINKAKEVSFVQKYLDINGVDSRLFKLDKNRFLLTNNFWTKDSIRVRDSDCWEGCMLMMARVVTLTSSSIDISEGIILCPQFSERIEKNWSIWSNEGKIYCSYGLTPHHEVFSLEVKGKDIICPDLKKIEGVNDIFYRLQKYYKDICRISLSTPALQWNNTSHIGVGHFKYEHGRINEIPHDSNLYLFDHKIKSENRVFHSIYVYLMFIYVFSSFPPYDILKVSNMFIPGAVNYTNKYALVFPSGLTFDKDNYIISYGDHDSQCKLLFLKREEIDNLLLVQTDPEKFGFK